MMPETCPPTLTSCIHVGFKESIQEPRGNLGVPMDISSPITSDEEYLSPMEEGMDYGGPDLRTITDARFKEPPAFLVSHISNNSSYRPTHSKLTLSFRVGNIYL